MPASDKLSGKAILEHIDDGWVLLFQDGGYLLNAPSGFSERDPIPVDGRSVRAFLNKATLTRQEDGRITLY